MKSKILVTDDNKEIRFIIKEILTDDFPGIKIFEAEDGEQALKIIKKDRPDLILSDIMMPKLNGLQLLKYLKENKDREVRKIPVIMLTSVGNKEISLKAIKMGATDYITKPFDNKLLSKKIRKYLLSKV